MDVREVLDAHNIQYKFSVKDYIVHCFSPKHEDSTPSCNVDKLSGVYHCWSCGHSGNIYAEFNINMPNQVNVKVNRLREKINKLMWSKPLEIPLGASFINTPFRNISAETLQHFNAFTSDDKGLDMEGRIIFPLEDIDSQIRLFLGRFMYSELQPKYKIYPEHTEIPLYPEIPDIVDGSIILVEGIFDLLNLYDKGLKNVVLCGGVHIGLVKKKAKQARNIERLLPYKYQGVHTIYTLFDGDEAGRKAASGLEAYAGHIFNIQTLDLPDGDDPGGMNQTEVNKLKEKLYGKSSNS
jgi:DNA primase